MDLTRLRKSLEAQNYVFDEEFLITVYVALKLEKPLLIEGAAGVGKTEVAKALAAVYGTELIRLQCYEGLDESKALYEWNYQKQLLSIQWAMTGNKRPGAPPEEKSELSGRKDGVSGLFSREYLLERPLLKAISCENSPVLLIDEIDKTDEEFEAFLLEMLSDYQVSIPEMGTIRAKSKPVVILTSNNTRQLSDALKRRCAYLYIDYPDCEKEAAIIHARLPGTPQRLAEDAAAAVSWLRQNEKILKKPSVAETLDWVRALMALDRNRLDEEAGDKTLGFLLKNREDITALQKDGGFHGFFSQKHS